MSYQLDPAMQAFIDKGKRFIPCDDSLEARRKMFLLACREQTPAVPAGWQIEDLDLDGLPLRCYLPPGDAPEDGWPTLLYLHGGGWDLGNLDTHDWFAFGLARHVNIAVVAVEYRLAPVHSYPAPLEDCLKTWASLQQGHINPNLSRTRLMVAGDSAGGTLAAGLCIALRREGQSQPLGQLLVYPVLTARPELSSMQEHAHAPVLTTAGLMRSIHGYLPNEADRLAPCAMPLEANDLTGLAPAWIVVARIDPLYDHGITYARELLSCGVTADVWVGKGMVHSSLRAFGVKEVELAWEGIAQQLQRWTHC